MSDDSESTAVGWLRSVVIDAVDPLALSEFWSRLLGLPLDEKYSVPPEWYELEAPGGVRMGFQPVPADGAAHPRIRLDIEVPELDGPTERAVALGATYLRAVHFRPAEEHRVFADPEGNEFNLVLPFPPEGLGYANT
jgi:predicted enzyme related to lactoylglutathione lyase